MNAREYARLRRETSARTVSTLVALFLGLRDYRDADADTFAREAVPLLTAGQATLGYLVGEYLAGLASAALKVTLAPLILPLDLVTNVRRGVSTLDVYRRPFVTIYNGLAEHGDMTRAVETGANRLAKITEMDLQGTYAQANAAGMERLPEAVRPDYWRRVLVGSTSCALCVLASTRTYKRGDLNPIHPACDCEVRPIMRGQDPFAALDDQLYARAHAAAQELTGEQDSGGRKVDYRRVATTITAEHGEHASPLLVRPGDNFTGPTEIPNLDPQRVGADRP